jgi:hypothetical protein
VHPCILQPRTRTLLCCCARWTLARIPRLLATYEFGTATSAHGSCKPCAVRPRRIAAHFFPQTRPPDQHTTFTHTLAQFSPQPTTFTHNDDHPFIVLTETKLGTDIYLFGFGTLLSGLELKHMRIRSHHDLAGTLMTPLLLGRPWWSTTSPTCLPLSVFIITNDQH